MIQRIESLSKFNTINVITILDTVHEFAAGGVTRAVLHSQLNKRTRRESVLYTAQNYQYDLQYKVWRMVLSVDDERVTLVGLQQWHELCDARLLIGVKAGSRRTRAVRNQSVLLPSDEALLAVVKRNDAVLKVSLLLAVMMAADRFETQQWIAVRVLRIDDDVLWVTDASVMDALRIVNVPFAMRQLLSVDDQLLMKNFYVSEQHAYIAWDRASIVALLHDERDGSGGGLAGTCRHRFCYFDAFDSERLQLRCVEHESNAALSFNVGNESLLAPVRALVGGELLCVVGSPQGSSALDLRVVSHMPGLLLTPFLCEPIDIDRVQQARFCAVQATITAIECVNDNEKEFKCLMQLDGKLACEAMSKVCAQLFETAAAIETKESQKWIGEKKIFGLSWNHHKQKFRIDCCN